MIVVWGVRRPSIHITMWQDEGVFISLWGGVRGFRELANGMGSKENILGSKKKKKKRHY